MNWCSHKIFLKAIFVAAIAVVFLGFESGAVFAQVPPKRPAPGVAKGSAPAPKTPPTNNAAKTPAKPAVPPVNNSQTLSSPKPQTTIPAPGSVSGSQSPSEPTTTIDQLLGIPGGAEPLPINSDEPAEPLEKRMARKITLDVRDMSVLDVLRFLALKGDFNLVTSSVIQGRATFYLKSVSIKDALNIAVLSNKLAYAVENDIVRVMGDDEFTQQYGKSFSDKKEVEIVHLNYAKPSYALSALEGVKSSLGQIIVDEDTGNVVLIDTRQTIEKMKRTLADIEKPAEPIVYAIQYAKADVVAEKLKGRIDQQAVGSITVDERTNKLVIRALAGRRDEVLKILKDLDAPTKEVLIEVRVLSIVFSPSSDMGIDWTMAFKDSSIDALRNLSFSNIMMNESTLSTSSGLYSNFGRIAVGKVGVSDFTAAIRALKQVSDTKLVANPKLLVTNGEEAKIHVGDTVPYIVSTTSGTDPATAIHSEDVRFVDVGLKLSVTPTINDNGYVTMALKPEISTVTKSIASQGGGIPQITKTEVETNVMVKDGMTIILGGLKKDQKISTHKGIPGLMDMPLLGRFFRSSSESIEDSETVIFITPHIVTGKENSPERHGATIKPSKEYDVKPKMGIKP